ncbi:MAG: methyltransferase [Halarcobacter sp.]
MKKVDNKKFYKKAYEKYGISAKGVHWSSKSRQYIRFEVLTSFIKDQLKDSSLIDVGCGYGEYLNYLKNENKAFKSYLGIDCEGFMINICQKRFSREFFRKVDVLEDEIPQADYLICSGALNILVKDDFKRAIENCYKASKKGFIFNFLREDSFNLISKNEVQNLCKKLSSDFYIKDDYLENDCTIFIKK